MIQVMKVRIEKETKYDYCALDNNVELTDTISDCDKNQWF